MMSFKVLPRRFVFLYLHGVAALRDREYNYGFRNEGRSQGRLAILVRLHRACFIHHLRFLRDKCLEHQPHTI